ncbi:MAG: Uma2 family endonuclease [Gemmatimonadetes bacterium]|nr:Uma2 family endonuclease [Gemmatimonadota bacterium]
MGRVAPRPPDRRQDLGRPFLVIKVLSPDTRRPDRGTKRHLYQALGIPE